MSKKNSFRVLSYNIHKGFGQLNRKYLLNEIRHSIRLTNADILFLQEVVGRNDKHKHNHHENSDDAQLEYLADTVWHHYAYGKNAIYEHGHHGNAILSKYPFNDWKNIDVSCVKKSQRGILCGQLNNNLNLLCTHFGLLPKEQEYQLNKLTEQIDTILKKGEPLILAGDFNDFLLRSHKGLSERFAIFEVFEQQENELAKTFPSLFPLIPLDRIYYSGLDLINCERLTGKPWNKLSDHCALYAEFTY